MKMNSLVLVLPLFLFSIATSFSDVFCQTATNSPTNILAVPPRQISKQRDFELIKEKAEEGNPVMQYRLGSIYQWGAPEIKNITEAVKWYRKAAERGYAEAQSSLGSCLRRGEGSPKDLVEAARWFRKAAEQGLASGQFSLACCYEFGEGVVKDNVEAYKWFDLAASQSQETISESAKESLQVLEHGLVGVPGMTEAQIAEAQRLAREFKPRRVLEPNTHISSGDILDSNPFAIGTGFFITDDGYFISNNHVVKDATKVSIVTSAGTFDAKVIQTDAANDLALMKAEGHFTALPITPSRKVSLGSTVATVGFPDPGLQGFSPKLAKGEIASLSGAGDDARYFQISVPVQPGNSGGALVDEYGNVVGIVAAKLNAAAALQSSGSLPENVNYAIKSSYLLSFLESVPAVSAKLKDPLTADRKFEDVVKSAQDAAVLVLVY